MYNLYFDGGLKDKLIRFGFVLYKDDVIIQQQNYKIAAANFSSNTAEYFGLMSGLIYCIFHDIDNVNIFTDSLNVVEQITHKRNAKSRDMVFCRDITLEMLSNFKGWHIQWISRKENRVAHRNIK